MPLFGMTVKSRRKAGISGFHAEYLNDRTAIRQRKQMGYLRCLFSVASLFFGGAMFYVALHYIPAFLQPKQILKLATNDSVVLQLDDFDRKSDVHKFFGPVTKLFQLDRAYMKSGQSIGIKYDLPDEAYANLHITQCKREWVLEIFACKVIGQFNTKTKRQNGAESFELDQDGFYTFKYEVINVPKGEPYRIIWERGE